LKTIKVNNKTHVPPTAYKSFKR